MPRPQNRYPAYHAHVYFDSGTADQAAALCEAARDRFGISMGRMHRKLVGPHPRWSCQLAFDREQFPALIDWLDSNRAGLNILVHGVTGDDLADHTDHAAWLGDPSPLDLSMFGG